MADLHYNLPWINVILRIRLIVNSANIYPTNAIYAPKRLTESTSPNSIYHPRTTFAQSGSLNPTLTAITELSRINRATTRIVSKTDCFIRADQVGRAGR